MKSLTTLIKLQKTRVDEQRTHIARLQDHLDRIERGIAELEIEKAREQVAAQNSDEARLTYGAFLQDAVRRGLALDKDRQVAAAAVEKAREVLIELFEEQKRYEIAEEARLDAEAAEERKRERHTLDEVGGNLFIRKKGD